MRAHRSGSIAALLAPTAALAVLAVLVATGCFSDRGIALEVEVGDTGATMVELYLGATRCDPATNKAEITCTSIAPPPDGKVALPGEIWFRDGPEPETAPVKGGKATFQLRADEPTTLPIVVAVGFASAESTPPLGVATLRDLTVPVHSARVVSTTLAAATARPAANVQTGEDRVQIWRKATSSPSCVMVEHTGTAPVTRDFVVPADDPDCDGAMPECNPAAYLSSNQVGGVRDRPGCFTQSGGPACVLGAFGCQDNVTGHDSTCTPLASRTCVPSAFCGCTAFDETCTRDKVGMAGALPRIDCQVPTLLSLDTIGLCPNRTQATIDLGMFFPGGACPQPEIGALPGTGFDDHHTFAGAKMKLSSPSKPCKFTVTWSEGTRPQLAAMDEVGILRFASDASPTLLVPIVFHFLPPNDNCITTDFKCSYAGDAGDSLWTCAH